VNAWRLHRQLRSVGRRQGDVLERLRLLRELKNAIIAEEARVLSEARTAGLTWKQIEAETLPDATRTSIER